MRQGLRPGLIVVVVLCWSAALSAATNVCEICGRPLGTEAFIVQDRVSLAKKEVCSPCVLSGTNCFICGLPARNNITELSDGRVLCERDAATSVLTQQDGTRNCRETRQSLGRLFWKYLAFPETNVGVTLVDRIHLQEEFKVPGNDQPCPNVWGHERSLTNAAGWHHEISVLSGLPLAGFAATCAHEYTHAWMNESLSLERKKGLSRDSVEGFCELIAFLLMESQLEEGQKELIKLNAYTRGQIDLFIEAEQRYGFNDVLKWVKYGADDRLRADELARIRKIDLPQTATRLPGSSADHANPNVAVPEFLTLKAIFWRQSQPLAIINDQTFGPLEEAEVRLGSSKVVIRCLEIRKDGVRVRMVGSGEERELTLTGR